MEVTCQGKKAKLVVAEEVSVVIPTSCPVCGGAVARDGAALVCQNDECDGKAQRKVRRWLKSLDIKFVGPEIETALYESGMVKDPADLYALSRQNFVHTGRHGEDFSDLLVGNGQLGEKRAQQILQEIERKKQLTLAEFLGSLGIRFLGKRAMEEFIKKSGRTTLNAWLTMTKDESVVIGAGIGPVVVDGLAACEELIVKLLAAGVTVADDTEKRTEETPMGGKLSGKVVCFTGVRPKPDEQAKFTSLGGVVKDGVSKNLTHLIVKDPNTSSNKAEKAQSLGVKIVGYEEFKTWL